MKTVEHVRFGPPGNPKAPRFHFIANGMFGSGIGGGDVHFFEMARSVIAAGYRLHFFGGHALREAAEERLPAWDLTLTESKPLPRINDTAFSGHLRLFSAFFSRCRATLRCLDEIAEHEPVYAVTDYWFDALPAVRCRAKHKLMIDGMDAPTAREIIFRSRPDVTALRINSIHYWLSQNLSLRWFRRCPSKRLLYVHPDMKPRLLGLGYRADELVYVSNGCNVEIADHLPAQRKEYDAIWLGRIHKQKGIDDLLATLRLLRDRLPGFRAVLVGNVEAGLKPRLAEMGILDCVHFTGRVSEEEKFRLFKASRVFIMPSHHESWGIVIAEALACAVPVVAYDLAAYRPVFGSLVRYARCFDLENFQRESLALVSATRENSNLLSAEAIADFKRENSWTAAGKRFLAGFESLRGAI
jgi:glycosyltransferase involved in cell wall biosynthesis